MEGQGRSRKFMDGLFPSLDYSVIPNPFPLDFGFGTWIWDLDLGPGFGTGLGLDNCQPICNLGEPLEKQELKALLDPEFIDY